MSSRSPQAAVVAFLRNPENYPHTGDKPDHVETNQSHVFRVGNYAYKLFKAISRYRDNTTPAARLENAKFEISANRALAGDLYIGIFAVTTQENDHLTLVPAEQADTNQVVDYVVKLHRFNDDDLLYNRLFSGTLTPYDVYALGAGVARFHKNQSPNSAPVQGTYKAFLDDFRKTIKSYIQKVPCPYATTLLEDLHVLAVTAVDNNRLFLENRNHSWRFLHGDLDFGNIVDFNGQLMPFDAQVLFGGQYINDPARDAAYMLAPLYMYGRPDLAERLLSGYQSVAHDRALENVLPLWVAYACIVRGSSWLSRLEGVNSPQQVARMEAYSYRYLQVAKRFLTGKMTLR